MRCLLLTALLVFAPASVAEVESLAKQAERLAEVAATERVLAPDRFEVIVSRFGGASRVDGDVRLVPVETRGPNASGIVQVVFRMLVDGAARGEARASVRGRVFGPALQAAATLEKGRVLAAADLAVRETDLTRLTEPPLRDPEQATGRVPVRTLARGRVMTGSLLADAPVVFRGRAVDLRLDRRGLNIVVSAIPRRDAAPGEIVELENIATGVRLHGRVLPDGTAELVRR